MSDAHNDDHDLAIADLVDEAVLADPDSVEVLVSGERLRPRRARCLLEAVDHEAHATLDGARQSADLLRRGGANVDDVSHAELQTQLGLELLPGD